MKRLWIAIAILLLAVVISVVAYASVTSNCNKLENCVNILVTHIKENNASAVEKDKKALERQWDKSLSVFSCVITHSHFDHISSSIDSLLNGKTKSDKELLKECESVIYNLNHLKDSEKLNTRNIL